MTETVKSPYPPRLLFRLIRGFGYVLSKLIWQIEFRGTENIPKHSSSGLVVAPNHQTYLDPFWIVIPIDRRFRFIAWDKVFNRPMLGKIISYLGAFPVNIEGGDQDAYNKSVQVLRDGATLMIFPEGAREFTDGKLLDFKTGAVRMAIEANVPILPVTISGANKVWSREMENPKLFKKIIVTYHPLFHVPAPPAGTADLREYARPITAQLKQIIANG